MPKLPMESMKAISQAIRSNAKGHVVYFMAFSPTDGVVTQFMSTETLEDIAPLLRAILDNESEDRESMPRDAQSLFKS